MSALSAISDLVSSAQLAASQLPLVLAAAESALDTAEQEYRDGLYSPFWEAIEESVRYLKLYDDTLRKIEHLRQRYAKDAPPLRPEAREFSLGVQVLPDPAGTKDRLNALYRRAQQDPDYANIYEIRRNTIANIEGFRSLGDAIYGIGDRLVSALESLDSSLDIRFGDMQTALRESSMQLEMQRGVLLQESNYWKAQARSDQSQLVAVANANATRAQQNADAMRVMLDNIQRRRKPGLLGF